MSSNHTNRQIAVLVGVVITGAARTIFTKVFFQIGYNDPFFLTVLTLCGHLIALPAYFLLQQFRQCGQDRTKDEPDDSNATSQDSRSLVGEEEAESAQASTQELSVELKVFDFDGNALETQESEQYSACVVKLVGKIPSWAKPLITGIFTLCDRLFQVFSVYFMAASIADMLSTGLEVFFILLVEKFIRKSHVLPQRWAGSFVVIAGLVIVALADYTVDSTENTGTESLEWGLLCVIGKIISGVGLAASQEIFTQESNIPATLLLGVEALYALAIFIPIYFVSTPLTGLDPIASFGHAFGSAGAAGSTFGLMIVFYIAGAFQILGASETSVATRNLWTGSYRGPVVWSIALTIYYASGGSQDIGEPWYVPGSFIMLAGVLVLFAGVQLYNYRGTFYVDFGCLRSRGNENSKKALVDAKDLDATDKDLSEWDADTSEQIFDIWV